MLQSAAAISSVLVLLYQPGAFGSFQMLHSYSCLLQSHAGFGADPQQTHEFYCAQLLSQINLPSSVFGRRQPLSLFRFLILYRFSGTVTILPIWADAIAAKITRMDLMASSPVHLQFFPVSMHSTNSSITPELLLFPVPTV